VADGAGVLAAMFLLLAQPAAVLLPAVAVRAPAERRYGPDMANPSGRPVIVLAHGAGLPSSSPWMRGWARRLTAIGDVHPFDYQYVTAGRKTPDRLPVLLAAHRAALDAAVAAHRGAPVVLAGKSLGARVSCHLAAELPRGGVAASVCLGYPLVGASGEVRDEVLLALATPILFVQGTRDRLCPLERLEEVRRRMRAPSAVHVVEGGDHSLVVTARQLAAAGEKQGDVDTRALGAIARFVSGAIGA
jgi:predicted alpha/beta-hydrolase family hydrolase